MKMNKWWMIVNSIAIAGILIVVLSNRALPQKIAYVELGKVFIDFQMKKELESKIKKIQETRKGILDSMKLELQVLSRQIESEKGKDKEKIALFSVKRETFFEKEKMFSEDNEKAAKMYDDQIFSQINQYTKDYGDVHDYTVILGAEGSGALMYAKDAINITDEVKQYINERYKGAEK